MTSRPTALIADDEPLLRERLRSHSRAVAGTSDRGRGAQRARGGGIVRPALPRVVFLDVHMPGLNGIEAARSVARRAEIVFVTAYEQYAVQAFQQGALDYLVKPFDEARLADTVQRLQARRARPAPAAVPAPGCRARQLVGRVETARRRARSHLQWIKASVGTSVRLIPVEQVAYLRADEKYTLVVWEGGEALIRKTHPRTRR